MGGISFVWYFIYIFGFFRCEENKIFFFKLLNLWNFIRVY